MNPRRKRTATVHDLSTLQLHPDGKRVHQSSLEDRPRLPQSTVRDERGNWIAEDATGFSRVKKTRYKDLQNLGEDLDGADRTEEIHDPAWDGKVGADGELDHPRARKRARLEEAEDHMDYFHPPAEQFAWSYALPPPMQFNHQSAASTSQTAPIPPYSPHDFDLPVPYSLQIHGPQRKNKAFVYENSTLVFERLGTLALTGPLDYEMSRSSFTSTEFILPTSDLLKSIHYFATKLYTTGNQLHNMGAQYEAEKKANKRARIEEAGDEKGSRLSAVAANDDDDDHESGSESESEEEEEEADEENPPGILEHTPWGARSQLGRFVPSIKLAKTLEPEDDDGGSRKKSRAGLPPWKPRPRSKKKREKDRAKIRDVFKAMDGSALLALGFLIHDYVDGMIMHQRATIPDGWREEMDYFYPLWKQFASVHQLQLESGLPPPPQLEARAETDTISEGSGSELDNSSPAPPEVKKAKKRAKLASGRPKKKVRIDIPHN